VQDFTVEAFGAKADGGTDCTAAFAAAVAACHQAGGGRVVAAQGIYRTAAIHLLSNVNLHIATGSTLSFYTQPERYLPAVFTRWEGMEMMGYSPLIYAYGQQNIAITGGGTLDGNANDSTWWPWKGPNAEAHWDLIADQDQKPARDLLMEQVKTAVPARERIHADGSFLRPSFIQPYACQSVLIEGITIINSPFWLLHPVLCESVTVRGVTCRSHGPNNDGCDPESCKNVLIEGCVFDTGDDCIALKSGRNEDGHRLNVAVENVVVRNCQMRDGHGGLVLGSEISGGARNIFMEDCTMNSPHLERAIRIKTNARRGGLIEHIRVRNLKIGQVQDAVVVNFYYEEGEAGEYKPTVRDIVIDNMHCDQAQRAFYLRGFATSPLGAIRVQNSSFKYLEQASVIEQAPLLELRNVKLPAIAG
jgi:polygalacturonase